MALPQDAQANVRGALEKHVGAETGVPGLVFIAIDKQGNHISEHTVGNDALSSERAKPMSFDTVFWIASCTKMIVGLAAMQLVEQGKLDLDSSEQLYKLCPELKDKQVLVSPGKYEPKKKEITTRMLLTHTAGFGYTFFDNKLKEAGYPLGWDEFSGDEEDIVNQPLVNQPGSKFQYGISIDWAGIAIMRLTGQSLQEHVKANIFDPLGIEAISFTPNEQLRSQLVTCVSAQKDGKFADVDHPFRRAIFHAETSKKSSLFQSAGAGCVAKPKDYVKILAALLNDGTSPTTGKTILKKETVDAMFENQIPQFPQFGHEGRFAEAAKPFWSSGIDDAYPGEGNPDQGWGLSFLLTYVPGMTGRGEGTAHWSGITNLHWWCDRKNGVAGMIAAQTLPFPNLPVLMAWLEAEKAIYDGLKK